MRTYNKNYFDEAYFTKNTKSNMDLDNENMKDVYFDTCQVNAKICKPLIPEGGRTLDVGCGMGRFVHELSKLGFESYGVDVSPYAINECLKTYDADGVPHFQVVDITEQKLPFPDDYFDLVTTFDVLEHIPFDKHAFVFNEIVRVCKRGFLILGPVFHDPSLQSLDYTPDDESHIALAPVTYYLQKFRDLGLIQRTCQQTQKNNWTYMMLFEKRK